MKTIFSNSFLSLLIVFWSGDIIPSVATNLKSLVPILLKPSQNNEKQE